jgi:hypothetical protein
MTAPHTVLEDAIIRRYLEASRGARERLRKAKSKSEKVKATIAFVAARYRMEEELNDGEQRAREIIDLIDSEKPLDRESRRMIGKELRRLFFPEPIDHHIRDSASGSADDAVGMIEAAAGISPDQKHEDVLKGYLQSWAGLTATTAEEEVARYFGIKVEALKQREKRAGREVDQYTADHLGIDVKTLRERRRLAKREQRSFLRKAKLGLKAFIEKGDW